MCAGKSSGLDEKTRMSIRKLNSGHSEQPRNSTGALFWSVGDGYGDGMHQEHREGDDERL